MGEQTGDREPDWTAYDVAQAFGWSIEAARRAIRRWRDAGWLEPAGKDAVTFAITFRPEDVRAAVAREAQSRASADTGS